MIRSYRYRLQMSARHRRAFDTAKQIHNQLYNAALEERIGAWQKAKVSVTRYDQQKSLTEIRAALPEIAKYAVTMVRLPLEQVDLAMKGFFERCKKGKTPGFPRYRSIARCKSFGFIEATGWKLDGHILRMKGLPAVRIKQHRPLEGKCKKLILKETAGRWYAIFVMELPDVVGPPAPTVLGIDVGIEAMATDSDGDRYDHVRPERSNANRRIRAERMMAESKKGTRRRLRAKRRLAKLREREANARRTRHFQIASQIVGKGAGHIVIEDLAVANMMRSASGTIEQPGTNVAAKSGLNRSIADAAPAQFLKILSDKAESAGARVIVVDPRYTSKMCSGCGDVHVMTLKQRWLNCRCGNRMHRDHNAAINIQRRGLLRLIGA